MITIRNFLYISIPLLILSALKGGGFLADYLEMVIYIVPFAITVASIIGVLKRDFYTINNRILSFCLILLILLWGAILSMHLFGEQQICRGFTTCDFLTTPKILITLLVSLTPILILMFFKKAKKISKTQFGGQRNSAEKQKNSASRL